MDVCENYWDACISDNPLAKYDDTVEYGKSECKKVTDRACGSHRVDKSSIPGSEPEDTTAGAFDLGPYSTVSQVTMPRISLGIETAAAVSGLSGSTRVAAGWTTAPSQTSSSTAASSPTHTSSATSVSPIVEYPSSAGVAQVTEVSEAVTKTNGARGIIITSVAGAAVLYILIT